MSPSNLLRKSEAEIAALRKFAYNFLGFRNLSQLPSGTAQLQQLRKPAVAKLWAQQNPVRALLMLFYRIDISRLTLPFFFQDRDDVDYDDPTAVAACIPATWWLDNVSCKYILSVLVHKNNKDISTTPTLLPSGPKRKAIRESKKKAAEQERAAARAKQRDEASSAQRSDNRSAVPRSVGGEVSVVSDKLRDDVDLQAKKARIDGMRSVIDLKRIDAINTQIAVMERLEKVYVARMGRDMYERKLVNLANKLPDMLEEEEESAGNVELLSPAETDNVE